MLPAQCLDSVGPMAVMYKHTYTMIFRDLHQPSHTSKHFMYYVDVMVGIGLGTAVVVPAHTITP